MPRLRLFLLYLAVAGYYSEVPVRNAKYGSQLGLITPCAYMQVGLSGAIA